MSELWVYPPVVVVGLVAGGLTLFTGFGLGTLLLPAFIVFFPPEVAIAATAVAHLANSAFKVLLVGGWADRSVVVRFGVPAVVAAIAGGLLLEFVGRLPAAFAYTIGERTASVTPIELLVGVRITVFGVLELRNLERARGDGNRLALGGVLSGFFGGLSGHQGALRSAFLIRAGLEKEAFVGTGAVIACMVDVARLFAYLVGATLLARAAGSGLGAGALAAAGPVVAATLAGFVGAFAGARLVKKVRLRTVRALVGLLLVSVGVLSATGLLTLAKGSA